MSCNYVYKIKKLQRAMNMNEEYRLLYCTSEFYSPYLERTVTMFYIKQATHVENRRSETKVLFKSASQLRVLFFMRDMYELVSNKNMSFDEKVDKCIEKQNNYVTRKEIADERRLLADVTTVD